MSAAGRTEAPTPPASDLAAALADAGFVRLVASADGDAAAATGLLASALAATGTPFQASILDPFETELGATQAEYTVAIGDLAISADAAVNDDVAASATAFDVAGELAASAGGDGEQVAAEDAGAGPDPILALAGTIAAGEVVPPVVEVAEAAGVERRPGVAVPGTDLADGLAHSTLFHAPFSGDVDAASEELSALELPTEATGAPEVSEGSETFDEDDRRRLASLVALDASGADGATERAAEAVERALHSHVGGPFETVGGYADVLDATAREQSGVALSLALGHDGAREQALSAWREHGAAAHEALSGGEATRHDGLFVVRAASMPVATVARLAADFRSPEPVALAVADGEAAIHAVEDADAAAALETAMAAVEDVDGTATGTDTTGRARFETDDGHADWTETGDDLVAAVREAL